MIIKLGFVLIWSAVFSGCAGILFLRRRSPRYIYALIGFSLVYLLGLFAGAGLIDRFLLMA
jgi:hypothetical protein